MTVPCAPILLTTLALGLNATQVRAAEFVAPYVQTVAEDVALILDLADVRPHDYLIDLGSGDGRFVIGAGKRGAMAHGVELDPQLVDLARENAEKAGLADRVAFIRGDIFEANIGSASVVTIYLFPEANIQLRPKLLTELKPGTRVVSNSFHMGDWEPDARVQGRTSGGALLWIIPASVNGIWEMKIGDTTYRFALKQEYQQVTAEEAVSAEAMTLSNVRLRGAKIWLTGQHDGDTFSFSGYVKDGSMKGIAHVRDENSTQVLSWKARRVVANETSVLSCLGHKQTHETAASISLKSHVTDRISLK